MSTHSNNFQEHLSRSNEINLSVTGRKSGHSVTIPVWFVTEGNTLYLLPVQGSDTQWYKNVLKNPKIRIEADGAEAELTGQPTTDTTRVKSVVEKFRDKYGTGDVTKYYSKFDVAVLVPMP
jgi:deazaflavin-dependent oxidoreductase (nitroreductase family)